MEIRHIVAATDESEAGRQAVHAAMALAARTGARVTVMRAEPAPVAVPAGMPSGESTAGEESSGVARLRRWVGAALSGPVSFAVTYGLPGVEISRFAECERADLVVLGRKPRSVRARLAVGDTADAVARRSLVPCLFVPTAASAPGEVLAAIDGTDRGMRVLIAAENFARQVGAELRVVTVARGPQIGSQVRVARGRALEVREGDPVEEILAVVEERRPDVLVIGCHRGGPPGIIDAGSTARRLAHTAPCAILTVPL